MPLVLPPTLPSVDRLLRDGSYNGLGWGPGTQIHVSAVSGFDDLPNIRSSDTPRALDHGAYAGVDLLDGRAITLDLTMIGGDYMTYTQLLRQVQAATVVQPGTELPMLLYGSAYLLNCRPRRRTIPYDTSAQRRNGVATIEFFASDPRVYSATQTALSVGLATPTGGATWPWSWPLSWGSAASGGTLLVTNNGNFETRPVCTIRGPVTNPWLECISSVFDRTVAFAITLSATDTLTVDFDARSVLLNGTASRRSTLMWNSQWWHLPPGTSTVNFRANSYASGAQMTMTYRDAWI